MKRSLRNSKPVNSSARSNAITGSGSAGSARSSIDTGYGEEWRRHDNHPPLPTPGRPLRYLPVSKRRRFSLSWKTRMPVSARVTTGHRNDARSASTDIAALAVTTQKGTRDPLAPEVMVMACNNPLGCPYAACIGQVCSNFTQYAPGNLANTDLTHVPDETLLAEVQRRMMKVCAMVQRSCVSRRLS